MEKHNRVEVMDGEFSYCLLPQINDVNLDQPYMFLAYTEEEVSLFCPTEKVPQNVHRREDGWRLFRIAGKIDFSVTGVIAKLSATLADKQISLSTISTFHTDYLMVKADQWERAKTALAEQGYELYGE